MYKITPALVLALASTSQAYDEIIPKDGGSKSAMPMVVVRPAQNQEEQRDEERQRAEHLQRENDELRRQMQYMQAPQAPNGDE